MFRTLNVETILVRRCGDGGVYLLFPPLPFTPFRLFLSQQNQSDTAHDSWQNQPLRDTKSTYLVTGRVVAKVKSVKGVLKRPKDVCDEEKRAILDRCVLPAPATTC